MPIMKQITKKGNATLFTMWKSTRWTVKHGFLFVDNYDLRLKFQPNAEDENNPPKAIYVANNPYELYRGALYVKDTEPNIDRIARIFLEWKLEEREKHRKLLEDTEQQIEFLNRKTKMWKESEEEWINKI